MSTSEKSRVAARAVRNVFAAFAAVGVVAALAACGASPKSGETAELKTGNEQVAFDDWQRDYMKCMSDEGVELGNFASTTVDGASEGLEDAPGDSGGPTASVDVGEIDMEAFEAADKVCTKKLGKMPVPPGMPSPEEMQEGMLIFAKCMREAGYDYPDPEFNEGGAVALPMVADDFDPAVMDACSEKAGFEGFSMGASIGSGSEE